MAVALYSFKIDPDGEIRVAHIFFGDTPEAAWDNLKAHADVCPKFGPAYREDQTREVLSEIAEIPTPEPESLDRFLDGE
jgi:hypothetical protein